MQMAESYKCPGCGAALVYQEGSKELVCPYCGTKVSIDELKQQTEKKKQKEQSEAKASAAGAQKGADSAQTAVGQTDAQSAAEQEVFHCESCGAELETGAYTAATMCPFCGSPVVLTSRLSGTGKPVSVLPFQIKKEEAAEKFREWTKSGLFTPKGFYSKATLDKIRGRYVPYWLFDMDASVHMRADATKVRTETDGDYEYTYTDHYQVLRDADTAFERIPADASKEMPDDTMERLEPYSYEKLEAFDYPYLSGYEAECTNFRPEELEPRARERAKEAAERATRNTIEGYSSVNVTSCQTNLRGTKQEYTMLPVWELTYRFRGKDWKLYLNGENGRKIGSLPVDPGRAAVCFGICSAAIFVLAAIVWGIAL